VEIGRIAGLIWRASCGLVTRNGLETSGYIAFTTMLALFPFLIFLAATAGFFGETETGHEFIDTFSMFAPPDVVKTLQPALQQVTENRSSGLLTFGLALALYSASSGVGALRLALDRAYNVEETRSLWRSKGEDFLVVIFGSIAIILCSVAIILGPYLWNIFTWFTRLDPSDQSLWHVARYIFTLILLAMSVMALHRVLPNTRLTFRQILPGALTSTVLWIVTASALTFYLGHFANYASTYGSLGGVIVTLLFFYVTGIIFIFGGELNAALLAEAGQKAALKPAKARVRKRRKELRSSPASS